MNILALAFTACQRMKIDASSSSSNDVHRAGPVLRVDVSYGHSPYHESRQEGFSTAEVEVDRSTFESADPILDEIAVKIDELLDSDQFAAVRALLARLSETVGPRYSVNLNVSVEVFDAERPNALPLLTLGLSTSGGDTPYNTCSDSTPQTYVVDGEIQMVPHDLCPKCYGLWDFKLDRRSCSKCGATLGQDVKLLLDADVCPFCEDGRVSLTAPVCAKCGQQIDPGIVVWG
jgi:ribosomal protein S27AE